MDMFNEEELKIFKNTGLHSVFFGEQISGPSMPSLAYMLAFKSMEERNINWENFQRILIGKEFLLLRNILIQFQI